MNTFSPAEIMENYLEIGRKKALLPVWKILLLGMLAGFLIGVAGVTLNTATHGIANPSAARVVGGLLFPFGLGLTVLLGGELFTGNCMLILPVLERRTTAAAVLRNWLLAYAGNFLASALLAAACVYGGQLGHGDGSLALHTMKLAASKCSIAFGPAVILGVLCNILVCIGVLCSLSAKDTAGKIMGAYLPVAFFVTCGFEHSVANMYYLTAGLFAKQMPQYAQLAAQSGLDLSALTWEGVLLGNLLPVTIGNIIGGAAIALLLWGCHRMKRQPLES